MSARVWRRAAKRRHVILQGFVGEWNLRARAFRYTSPNPNTRSLCGTVFRRAKDILGAKRIKGQRAVRVRIVLEEL